jgi:hypothetical protein
MVIRETGLIGPTQAGSLCYATLRCRVVALGCEKPSEADSLLRTKAQFSSQHDSLQDRPARSRRVAPRQYQLRKSRPPAIEAIP